MSWNFQHAFNIVFNMHYRFLHTFQISTCAEIFNMLFQDVLNTFQTWNSPMVWTMLKIVLETMSNISKCVENHVENFKVYWKTMSQITMMRMLCDPFHQFWNIIAIIKIKSDIINEDYRSLWCYMSSLIEILCGHEEKIGPVWMQFLHNMYAMENFWIQPCFSLFSFKLSKLGS